MLTKLTTHQEAQLEVYRDNSMAIGLKTGETTNKARVREIVNEYYKFTGKECQHLFFVKGPLAAEQLYAVICAEGEFVKNFKGSDEEFTSAALGMFDASRHKFKDAKSSVAFYGSHETYWLQYYEYFRKECNIKYDADADAKLSLNIEFSKNAGWLHTFNNFAIVADRPTSVVMENNVLSNTEGPAIAYADGLKIYVVGGHIVPEWIIMNPEKITLDIIKKESNSETKRIMIDRYGTSKYLFETAAKIIDMDQLNLEGSSPRALVEDQDGERWLIGTDGSTGRVYHMPAEKIHQTCADAHKAMCGFDETKLAFEC
jgi:hypothetical protein